MELTINPRFQEACPILKDEEYTELENNILGDGVIIDPILTWNGTIIDGHNRYKISQEHGVAFNTKSMEFASELDVVIWIKRHQLGTRNVSDEQKWLMMREIETLLKEKGAEKRKRKPANSVLSTVDKTNEDAHGTQNELAKELGWSRGKVATAQYVDKHADEATKKAVYSGKKTFNKAYKEIKKKQIPRERPSGNSQNAEYQGVIKVEKSLANVIMKMEPYDCLGDLTKGIKKIYLQFADVKKEITSK